MTLMSIIKPVPPLKIYTKDIYSHACGRPDAFVRKITSKI